MRVVSLVLGAIVATSCGYLPGRPTSAATPGSIGPQFPDRKVSIGKTVLDVWVAKTPEDRERGLQGLQDLAGHNGMLFRFDEPSTSTFWMRGVLLPLSAAFLDRTGRVLKVVDMEPCSAAVGCPTYDPGVTYWWALEAKQGSFHRWGLRRGDRVRL